MVPSRTVGYYVDRDYIYYDETLAGATQKQSDWLLRIISRNYKNVLLAKNQKYLNEIYLAYVIVGG